MDLNIVTSEDAERLAEVPQTPTADDLYARLLKYIPAPLLGIYLFLVSAVPKIQDHTWRKIALLVWVAFMMFMIRAYLRRTGVRRKGQVRVSLLAFLAYAAASTGPEAAFGWWDPLMGTAALAAFAAVIVAYNPKELPGP